MLLRFGYHFLSLFVIIGFMAVDVPPFKAVVYAVIIQFALSFLDREHRLTAGRLFKALAQGTRSVLPVAATCATAGVIVAVTTQTGLGLNLAEIIVSAAHGLTDNHTVVLILTVVLSGFAVLILGLAVPVTASFIIAAVIIAPALVQLGVTQPEAYMFIFYYAVLSEVLAADRAGRGGDGRDHRRQGDADDVAGVEVHAAGVPGAVRVRAHRQRRAPARSGIVRRHGVDDCWCRCWPSPRSPW